MFNGRTSAFQADDASSILATRSIAKEKYLHAHIAQSVEHFLGKEEVTGSNPVMSSTFEGFRDFIGLVESSEVLKRVYRSSLVVIVCIGGNYPLSIVEK